MERGAGGAWADRPPPLPPPHVRATYASPRLPLLPLLPPTEAADKEVQAEECPDHIERDGQLPSHQQVVAASLLFLPHEDAGETPVERDDPATRDGRELPGVAERPNHVGNAALPRCGNQLFHIGGNVYRARRHLDLTGDQRVLRQRIVE